MTLIIALALSGGVLVSADSRASGGYVIHEGKKIHSIYFLKDNDMAVLAGAGDAALVKQGFQMIEGVFREWFEKLNEGRNPDSEEVDEIVHEVERRLMLRYKELGALT